MFKKILVISCLVLFARQASNAQCVNASFSIPDTVCAGQILPIQNTSTGTGLTYEWDFCPIDMTFPNLLSATYTLNGYGFSSLDYFKLLKDNGQYIKLAFDTVAGLFVIGKSTVDITNWYTSGNSPLAVSYAIAGLPEANCFDVIKEGNTWMGLAAYNTNNSLYSLNFTNGFNGAPVATPITGINSLDNPASIKLVKHDGVYYAYITNKNDNSLVCLSFGNSMSNAPTQVYKSILAGANGLNDIDILPTCGSVIGFASNLSSGNLLKLEFDNDFTIQPTVTSVPTTAASTNGLDIAQEGTNYYVYFTGSDTAYRISYANNFSATPVQSKFTWGYPGFKDVEVLQDSSRNMFLFSNDAFKFFVTLPFPSTPCFNNTYSTDVVPVTSFPNTGTYSFSLTAFDTLGSVSTFNKTVVVVSGSATPEFSYSNTCFSVSDSVNFNDLSSGATGWAWNFGDGNTSNLQNPKHQYVAPGTYTVSLTINSVSGCQFVKSKLVTINPLPVVNFSSTIECSNSPTQFTDLSTITTGTLQSWNWQFGDGDSSLSPNPSHVYATGGTFNATLTVTSDSGCVSSTTLPVTVKPSPLVSFTSANACVGDTTIFTNTTTIADSSALSYQWFFGDGGTSILENPTHYYTGAGSYPLTLIATSANGCIDSINSNFIVSTPATPDFSFPATNCRGNAVPFTDLSSGGIVTNWLWHFGDGDSSTLQNPLHSYAASGNYSVTLRVSIGSACFSSITKTITILDGPTAVFANTTECVGNPTFFTDQSTAPAGQTINAWTWAFGDGNTSGLASTSNLYANYGQYYALLTVTTDLGCSDTTGHLVTVNANPNVSFSFPNLKCEDSPVVFTDNSSVIGGVITSWNWNFGDGNSSNNQNPLHSYSAGGSYLVTLTTTSFAGCSSTLQQVVVINNRPDFTFTAIDGCLGTATGFAFNNISGAPFSYQWLFDDGGQSFVQNPLHTYLQSGSFNVVLTVVDSNGCTGTYADTVVIFDIPNAAFTQLGICQNAPLNFTNQTTIGSGTVSGYLWDFGDGTTTTTTSPSHVYTTAGTYQVNLYATATGGCTDTATKTVTIKPIPSASFTSQGFSSPGLSTNFNNTTTGATSYQWNFGDGGSSLLANPSYSYNDTGSYVVSLIATSSFGCIDTATQSFLVLEPYIDLGVRSLSHSINSGILTINAGLTNNGNVAANNYKIQISFDGGNTVLETSNDTILPSQTKIHQVNTQFVINSNALPAYYCLTILKVNGVSDMVESNNYKCEAIATEFVFAAISPNPSADQISLNYYLPLDDVVTIDLFDSRGRKIKQLTNNKKSRGLQQETYSLIALERGVYFCKIKYRDAVIEKRFLKL